MPRESTAVKVTPVTRTVIVRDTQPPVITTDCATLARTLSANANCKAAVPNFKHLVDATDACMRGGGCSYNSLKTTQDPKEGTMVGLGTTTVTVTVTDAVGLTATCTVPLTVLDTAAPKISALCANPSTLWPADHGMVTINLLSKVQDACTTTPACKIISVTSNEPVSGTGAGDLSPDWVITGDMGLQLRAERSDSGSGRTYTITVECKDAAGNATTATTKVSVPRSQKKCSWY